MPVISKPFLNKFSRQPAVLARRREGLIKPFVRRKLARMGNVRARILGGGHPYSLAFRLSRLRRFGEKRALRMRGESNLTLRHWRGRDTAPRFTSMWSPVNMILAGGISIGQEGIPPITRPGEFSRGQVIPPFEPSERSSQPSRQGVSKPRPAAPPTRWKQPAPGTRLFSRVEEVTQPAVFEQPLFDAELPDEQLEAQRGEEIIPDDIEDVELSGKPKADNEIKASEEARPVEKTKQPTSEPASKKPSIQRMPEVSRPGVTPPSRTVQKDLPSKVETQASPEGRLPALKTEDVPKDQPPSADIVEEAHKYSAVETPPQPPVEGVVRREQAGESASLQPVTGPEHQFEQSEREQLSVQERQLDRKRPPDQERQPAQKSALDQERQPAPKSALDQERQLEQKRLLDQERQVSLEKQPEQEAGRPLEQHEAPPQVAKFGDIPKDAPPSIELPSTPEDIKPVVRRPGPLQTGRPEPSVASRLRFPLKTIAPSPIRRRRLMAHPPSRKFTHGQKRTVPSISKPVVVRRISPPVEKGKIIAPKDEIRISSPEVTPVIQRPIPEIEKELSQKEPKREFPAPELPRSQPVPFMVTPTLRERILAKKSIRREFAAYKKIQRPVLASIAARRYPPKGTPELPAAPDRVEPLKSTLPFPLAHSAKLHQPARAAVGADQQVTPAKPKPPSWKHKEDLRLTHEPKTPPIAEKMEMTPRKVRTVTEASADLPAADTFMGGAVVQRVLEADWPPSDQGSAKTVNIQDLARQVYPIIKHLLLTERERVFGRKY